MNFLKQSAFIAAFAFMGLPTVQAEEVATLPTIRVMAESELRGPLVPGEIEHTFTHFHLRVRVVVPAVTTTQAARLIEAKKKGATWAPLKNLDRFALPTIMKKIARHALENK